jgi:glycosyltransferase involved in cell wall biosynthesis
MTPLNLLLVSYSFPPAGGVGVLRAASLARYFPAEEIRLDVLTAHNASAVGADSALLRDIPSEVTIHRAIALDLPFGIKKWIKKLITARKSPPGKAVASADKPNFLKRILQDILLPDPQVTWLPALTRAAKRIVESRKIDLVLITVPPFSSVLLVERLRKEFPQLPIVVDFRDEWLSTTINLVSFSRSERALQAARDSEASAVRNATAVVSVTEAARREIRARYPLEPATKFHYIPNGFDATRLRNFTPLSGPRPGDKIIVTYIGTVYGSTEPTVLIEALQSLPSEVKSRYLFRFIGHIEEPRFREALLKLGDMVELKGFMPQHEALAAMNETNYALLISHDRLNVSAKFYDYIGAGKPILACIHPEGDVRILLEKLRAGWWADSRDAEAIRQLFVNAADPERSPLRSFQPDTAAIAQYERKPLAQRYAAFLHFIADSRRNVDSQAPAGTLPREAR